ncbi:hypothetical protein FS837_007914 [Tulasnella sp. UAMH 9824]|nr:hypothetical protein FS837_007914 [Tulasnella sp. UAMH 9824]
MSSPFDHHIDITPPITPLKSRRNCKKDLTPINIGLAQNHFKDAWSLTFRLPSLSPPPSSSSAIGELVSSFDSLDTPPLSAASSSLSTAGLGSVGGGGGGGLTTPLDAVHPLFRLMSLGDDAPVDPFSVGSGGDRGKMMLDGSFTYEGPDDEDVFTSGPTRGLLFDPPTSSATSSSLNIVPPTPLLSSPAFSPPANAFSLILDTAQYSYASSTDSMSFFSTSTSVSPPPSSSSPKTPTKAPSTASTSPSRTPKAQQAKENNKKKHQFRLNVFPTDWDPSDDEVDAVVRGLTTLTGLVDLDIQYFQGGAQVVRHLSVEYENDLGAPAWVCPWLTKLNVKDVPNINQSDWHALLETRGPRRTLRPSGAGYPVRIMELQENMERP